jgi:hypothetical protein
VSFHKTVEYQEINRFDDSVSYQALLADFTATFHDIRGSARFACLDPGQLYRLAAPGCRKLLEAARWASSTPACGIPKAPTWPASAPHWWAMSARARPIG